MLQQDRLRKIPSTTKETVSTIPPPRLPDFMIIGAAKCGTTTLHTWLSHHPDIFMADPKEPEFFSKDEVYRRGLDYYHSLFEQAAPNQVCGEGSTTYTRWPHTADASTRIAGVAPRARFIYLMRNPVDRAFSHYAHHMRCGVTMTFEDALRRSREYLDCGLYMEQIRRYLRYYPPGQFLFLLLEDLKRDPIGLVASVQRFLGVRELTLQSDQLKAENESGPDYYIRRHTTWRLRAMPLLSAVADRVPQSLRDSLYQVVKASPLGAKLQRQYRLPPMLPETRGKLVEIFREPNSELSDFLGRDLSHWNA